jgi:hypothetical protein
VITYQVEEYMREVVDEDNLVEAMNAFALEGWELDDPEPLVGSGVVDMFLKRVPEKAVAVAVRKMGEEGYALVEVGPVEDAVNADTWRIVGQKTTGRKVLVVGRRPRTVSVVAPPRVAEAAT